MREFQGMPLLYVGIAPGRVTSGGTLHSRLTTHVTGGLSTFRFSLASLMADELSMHFQRRPTGKGRFFGVGETRLNDWMGLHAFVAFVETPEPWNLEPWVIRNLEAMSCQVAYERPTSSVRLSRSRCGLGDRWPALRVDGGVRGCQ
ncbi:MAG: GIY-YIG nuclease family protein [Solirubrobacteraceae bacterium]